MHRLKVSERAWYGINIFLFSSLRTKTGVICVNPRNLMDDAPSAYVDLGQDTEHQARELQLVSNCGINDYFLVKKPINLYF